jgi:TRAP-type C4-dicarboxylate transport system permease small subunit
LVKPLDFVIKVIGYLLRILLIAAVFFIFVQVVCRYALNAPLTWTEQISRFVFIWMMMLGIPVLFHRKAFMAFDLLLQAIPGKAQVVASILIKVAVCIFAVFWFRGALELCIGTANKLTSGIRINYYWLYGAQIVSSALIFWVMLTQVVQETAGIFGKRGKEGEAR